MVVNLEFNMEGKYQEKLHVLYNEDGKIVIKNKDKVVCVREINPNVSKEETVKEKIREKCF